MENILDGRYNHEWAVLKHRRHLATRHRTMANKAKSTTQKSKKMATVDTELKTELNVGVR
jgi:hypothetical protein